MIELQREHQADHGIAAASMLTCVNRFPREMGLDTTPASRDRIGMRTIFRIAAMAFMAIAGAAPAAAAYFVVLGAFDAYGGDPTFDAAERLRHRANQCGVSTWTEYTSKIKGFQPGYFAVLIGPFDRRGEADTARRTVLPCVSDAYIKAGVDLGE